MHKLVQLGQVLITLGDPEHFIDGGLSVHGLGPTVIPQRSHPLLHRRLFDLPGAGSIVGQLANVVVGQQQFVDTHPPAVADVTAFAATDLAIQRPPLQTLPGEIGRHLVVIRFIRLAAMLAEAADEPLGHHGFHRAGDQEGLDPHIRQAGVTAGRIVRVQRAEHQVAR